MIKSAYVIATGQTPGPALTFVTNLLHTVFKTGIAYPEQTTYTILSSQHASEESFAAFLPL